MSSSYLVYNFFFCLDFISEDFEQIPIFFKRSFAKPWVCLKTGEHHLNFAQVENRFTCCFFVSFVRLQKFNIFSSDLVPSTSPLKLPVTESWLADLPYTTVRWYPAPGRMRVVLKVYDRNHLTTHIYTLKQPFLDLINQLRYSNEWSVLEKT